MTDLLQLTIYGIVLGSIFALGAVGLSLVYAILRFPHFAHGDFMTLGAYISLAIVTTFGVPPIIALPFGAAGAVLFAIAVDQTIYRRLRKTQPVILLISSVGTALILRALLQMIFGSETQVYQSGIQMPVRFGDLRVKPAHFMIVGVAAGLVLALHLFLQKTRVGKAMRAMSDNRDLAQVTGISVDRIVIWTWAIGIALAATAGVLLGMDTRLHPTMGWNILLPVFAAAILGGIGSPYGAIAGGLVIGIVQEWSTMVISPAYKPAVAFAIMVVMLLVRPTGLFAGRKV
ncbi:branched-chain amino acid ABC transporter permease [Tistrella mobilis]|uniref:Hydrophobic amino acid ABC transporter permease n=1 Tax=Tistrella mobilis (strain KA081020-065) TaxID=1110502 RepID=I3TX73_TISMK|nr:branched-chain amino acid ABC transporter permease [Tistrella mobilis]AFK57361.1 hydrophobic amino acid ABC transporter permease [Tistrella mobilis KA081020-065]